MRVMPGSHLNPAAAPQTTTELKGGGFLMTRWITFTFAIAAVMIVASSTLLRSHPVGLPTATMPSLAELHLTADVSRLPVQEISDQSLIFPLEARQ
jgi:hypothetical protein